MPRARKERKMQLLLQGKNFVISDRIQNYVEKKIGKLDRYLPDIEEVRVEINQEKTGQNSEKHDKGSQEKPLPRLGYAFRRRVLCLPSRPNDSQDRHMRHDNCCK